MLVSITLAYIHFVFQLMQFLRTAVRKKMAQIIRLCNQKIAKFGVWATNTVIVSTKMENSKSSRPFSA